MIGGDIEHVEVVLAGLDLGPEDSLEPQVGEDLAYLIDHLGHRMNRAQEGFSPRQGDVQRFVCQSLVLTFA